MSQFVIKGSIEFAYYAKNNLWDNLALYGNDDQSYYLIDNKKILGINYRNIWDVPVLTLEDLPNKYTIEQLKRGNYIFDLNKEQHAKLKSTGIDICDFYGEKCYSNRGTHGKLDDYIKGQILVNFADIEFKDCLDPKEIIGYKAPTDLFEGKVQKDCIYKYVFLYNEYLPDHGDKLNKNCAPIKVKLPKEIVETWEPVYKEVKLEFKTVLLGDPLREFNIYKNKIQVVTGAGKYEEFYNGHLSTLDKCLDKVLYKIDNYDLKVSAVQIGCVDGVELRLKDLNCIKETQNDL